MDKEVLSILKNITVVFEVMNNRIKRLERNSDSSYVQSQQWDIDEIKKQIKLLEVK